MPKESWPANTNETASSEISATSYVRASFEPTSQLEKRQFLREILQSRRELEIARRQFDQVSDPALIDHVVFRVGAAERHFNYLFQLAREWGISYQEMEWDWTSDEWKID